MAKASPRRRPGRPPLNAASDGDQRRRILAAATRVFARRGYSATDVQEIADVSGVGKASIYRRWASKEALFRAAIADGTARMMSAVLGGVAAEADPIARLRAGVHGYLAWWEANPDLMELVMLERTEFRGEQRARIIRERDEVGVESARLFGELAGAGLARALPARRLGQALGDRLYGLVWFDRLVGSSRPAAEQADEVVDLFLHGILTPAGRRRHPPLSWEPSP